jgi:hypothetical protein
MIWINSEFGKKERRRMQLTGEEIQRRATAQTAIGAGLSAASQAKGRPLVDAELIKVREMVAGGRTVAEIAAEFTPKRSQSPSDILDAFSRELARLREDLDTQGHLIRQLQDEIVQLKHPASPVAPASARNPRPGLATK